LAVKERMDKRGRTKAVARNSFDFPNRNKLVAKDAIQAGIANQT